MFQHLYVLGTQTLQSIGLSIVCLCDKMMIIIVLQQLVEMMVTRCIPMMDCIAAESTESRQCNRIGPNGGWAASNPESCRWDCSCANSQTSTSTGNV